MSMTKKDLELIAEIISGFPSGDSGFTPARTSLTREYIAHSFAQRLGERNPLFNTERFLKACGVLVIS